MNVAEALSGRAKSKGLMPYRGLHNMKTSRDWARHFLPLLRPFWKQLFASVLAIVLAALLSLFRPWPLKIVIDRVLSRSEEHTSELQSLAYLVCRLLLEKKKNAHDLSPYWLRIESYTLEHLIVLARLLTILIKILRYFGQSIIAGTVQYLGDTMVDRCV